jgi:hypothetical protein
VDPSLHFPLEFVKMLRIYRNWDIDISEGKYVVVNIMVYEEGGKVQKGKVYIYIFFCVYFTHFILPNIVISVAILSHCCNSTTSSGEEKVKSCVLQNHTS